MQLPETSRFSMRGKRKEEELPKRKNPWLADLRAKQDVKMAKKKEIDD